MRDARRRPRRVAGRRHALLVVLLRLPEQLRGLKAFLQRALPVTYLSAVVLQELEAGVSSARQADLLEEQLVGPFERRGRVFAPTAERGVAAARYSAGCSVDSNAPHPRRSVTEAL